MISKQNVLKLGARQQIYNFILKNPGIHVREISRRMDIPKTTLKHHFKYLKRQELITVKYEGKYKRIYASQKVGEKDKELLNLLRQETPFQILLYMLFCLACSQIDLSKELDKHPATIAYHLKKLTDMDIIQPAPMRDGLIYKITKGKYIKRSPIGSEKVYRWVNQETIDSIYNLLITHKESLANKKIIDTYVYWVEKVTNEGIPNKAVDANDAMDSVMEVVFEIFPHPYHA
ncbi:MAG: winged helix-turn-helix transcriptional regulator [Promethearchaeota archaeon]